MKEAAIGVCGNVKKGFSKKRDEWWNDEVQDAVERKKKKLTLTLVDGYFFLVFTSLFNQL